VEAAHCSTLNSIPDNVCDSRKVRRKLGQVCDPRWKISRPNDQLLLASAQFIASLALYEFPTQSRFDLSMTALALFFLGRTGAAING
jgi:hypothetical protein